MMEIKCCTRTLIALYIFFVFNLGLTCPGPSFYWADLPRADLSKGQIVQLPTELANCLETTQSLMGNNKLKLNCDKTELIAIGDDQIRISPKSFSR